MKISYLLTLSLTGIAFASGCSESNRRDEDAAIVFDARPEPDAGPSPVGSACTTPEDCPGLDQCIEQFPDGYCTTTCGADAPCPDGSECVDVGGGQAACLVNCDPTADDSCRAGYGCAGAMGTGVCIPGCESDDDCTDGFACDREGGFSGEGRCFDPESTLGDACDESADCPSDSFCFSEDRAGFPDGMCVQFGCDPETNTGCPGDAQCRPGGRGGICIDGCMSDDDCRERYQCFGETEDAPGYCNPAFADDDNLGQPCSAGRGGCPGGVCLSESEFGYPDSYCLAVDCDPEADESGCPADGVCTLPEGSLTGFCLDGCGDDDDCREGYRCGPSDATDDESDLACVPACSDDDECANEGFECNRGTGLCRPPFDEDRLGEPCEETASDCEGGSCVTEEGSGFPGGMCVVPGCRFDSSGPSSTCPDNSVCIDDERGDPALGICVPACTVGEETCREDGYACGAVEGDEGACQPACSADDCGSGRSCNEDTGRCEE